MKRNSFLLLILSFCLLAFTEAEDAYKLAMPSFESSAWLKDLVKIEVQ